MKVTFPLRWTNTCCSHNSHIQDELEAEPHFIGMRRACLRRTKFEFGINDLQLDDLKVVSRILYYAPSCDKFAEHELDYIIMAKKNISLDFKPNPDEIKSHQWVSFTDFEDFLKSQNNPSTGEGDITPWFKLLKDNKLMKYWWKDLINKNTFPDESSHIEKFD